MHCPSIFKFKFALLPVFPVPVSCETQLRTVKIIAPMKLYKCFCLYTAVVGIQQLLRICVSIL